MIGNIKKLQSQLDQVKLPTADFNTTYYLSNFVRKSLSPD